MRLYILAVRFKQQYYIGRSEQERRYCIFFCFESATPKTELAKRFREVQCIFGFTERKQFIEHLDLTASSIGIYKTGISEPTASALSKYQEICGVLLDWLITGKGKMFTDIVKVKTLGLDCKRSLLAL